VKRIIFVLLILTGSVHAQAGELNGVKFEDEVTVEKTKLKLNGMATRIVQKFGFPIKVYVAALYLEKKSSDSDAILKGNEVKHLILTFVRSVDRENIVEAFDTGFENGCFIDCENRKKQYKPFAESIVPVRDHNSITLTFYKDKMVVDTNGPYAKKQTLEGEALSRNMLSVFINKKNPPSEDFRKGLLGLK
jgi:hypothetical protein